MATIVRATVPAGEFALAETLSANPAVRIECERIVESGEGSVMPLVWAYETAEAADDALDPLESSLDDDPTVAAYDRLATFDDDRLYRMTWVEQVRLVVQLLTNLEASILTAYGDAGRWQLRVLYPDRDSLSRTVEFCEEYDLTFDVRRVRELDERPTGRYGLTEAQYETLLAAWEGGYFEVPRTVELEELAEEFDVSHQALSERIRRANHTLLEETLLVDHDE